MTITKLDIMFDHSDYSLINKINEIIDFCNNLQSKPHCKNCNNNEFVSNQRLDREHCCYYSVITCSKCGTEAYNGKL